MLLIGLGARSNESFRSSVLLATKCWSPLSSGESTPDMYDCVVYLVQLPRAAWCSSGLLKKSLNFRRSKKQVKAWEVPFLHLSHTLFGNNVSQVACPVIKNDEFVYALQQLCYTATYAVAHCWVKCWYDTWCRSSVWAKRMRAVLANTSTPTVDIQSSHFLCILITDLMPAMTGYSALSKRPLNVVRTLLYLHV